MKSWFALVAAIVVAAVSLGGASLAGGDQPRSQLSNFSCHTALDPLDRSVSAKVVMRPLAGTQKLQLKFDLLVSHDGTRTRAAVHVGNLGTWLTPRNPTLGRLSGDVWKFQKSVVELDAPASYQFKVSFRWLGAHGSVLATAVRYTRSCRQRELRPDLEVSSITVSSVSGHPNQNLYSAVVRNAGATMAGPFDVQFVPGPQYQTIQRLNPYSNRTVSFVGPPLCASAEPPTITADSAHQVDDLNRSNDSSSAICPATTTS
jgi:hypothetical protein